MTKYKVVVSILSACRNMLKNNTDIIIYGKLKATTHDYFEFEQSILTVFTVQSIEYQKMKKIEMKKDSQPR